MAMQTAVPSDVLVETLQRADVRHIIHIGGGDGSLLAALLGRLPRASGVLFEQPDALGAVADVIDAVQISNRVDVIEQRIHEPIPPGGDAYLVTAPTPDAASIREVIRACRDTMAPSALLLVCRRCADGRDIGPLLERDLGIAPIGDRSWCM